MSKKIKLNVLGISYSQTQTGAYALVLTEEAGDRRIPIIVGGFEAQSIAIQLEGLKPPRPLTHDLFLNFSQTFNITLLEVTIYKLEEGVFYSQLKCDNGVQTVEIDARTSDAIALALRFKCPIYTTDDIINKAGIVLDFDKESKSASSEASRHVNVEDTPTGTGGRPYAKYSMQDLELLLEESVKAEDYEKASEIKKEINKRKQE
ncbi:MAG: hypothetical protein GVY19_02845 [Bacteroidetes bacterium]|jgi:bifunctional DNase/RNase|nr:hypothetical protein [Bacteroidota bacterium]